MAKYKRRRSSGLRFGARRKVSRRKGGLGFGGIFTAAKNGMIYGAVLVASSFVPYALDAQIRALLVSAILYLVGMKGPAMIGLGIVVAHFVSKQLAGMISGDQTVLGFVTA